MERVEAMCPCTKKHCIKLFNKDALWPIVYYRQDGKILSTWEFVVSDIALLILFTLDAGSKVHWCQNLQSPYTNNIMPFYEPRKKRNLRARLSTRLAPRRNNIHAVQACHISKTQHARWKDYVRTIREGRDIVICVESICSNYTLSWKKAASCCR